MKFREYFQKACQEYGIESGTKEHQNKLKDFRQRCRTEMFFVFSEQEYLYLMHAVLHRIYQIFQVSSGSASPVKERTVPCSSNDAGCPFT